MARTPLLSLRAVGLYFGRDVLLDHADLFIHDRDRIALIGRNGSGKSTLLKIIAGLIEPDRGERAVKPNTRIEYLPQEPDLSGFESVLDYCLDGLSEADDHHEVLIQLQTLDLQGTEDPRHLSGGEVRRAALARVLARKPEILLLDEPTNHLDLTMIEWLTDEINRLAAATVIISHDRRFLADVSSQSLWLDRGLTRHLNRGFADFETWRDDCLEEEAKAAHKLKRKIADEEHWVRYGVTARRKRNMRRMRALEQLRETHRNRQKQSAVVMSVAEADISSKRVVEIEQISKRFGERVIVDDFSLKIMRGERVAIVGPNGAGKTTLINMITGRLKPDKGTVTLARKLDMASLDQKRASLDQKISLADALTGGQRDVVVINGQERHVFSYMKSFLFQPSQARTPLSVLSGGERARVMLARALALPSNFLVLDEPTNDLDLETLDLLQEMINDYPGTVLLVSHDRDFIDRTASAVIAPAGDGRWVEYAGGYSDMERQKKALSDNARLSSRAASAQQGETQPPRKPIDKGRHKQNKATQTEKVGASVSGKTETSTGATKLSFKQAHALKTLPVRLEGLEQALETLAEALADPDFYARDPERFAQASRIYANKLKEKTQLEDEWLELEVLKEQLERGLS